MRHDAAGASAHAGHQMPEESVSRVADSLSKGVADSSARRQLVDALFRLLEDTEVQRRVAADSALRRTLVDLLPLIPEEHRDHYRMLVRTPPPAAPRLEDRPM